MHFQRRFIQPVKRRSKRRFEKYESSSTFDSIIPVSGNVCSHKKSCDEFIVKVSTNIDEMKIAIWFG